MGTRSTPTLAGPPPARGGRGSGPGFGAGGASTLRRKSFVLFTSMCALVMTVTALVFMVGGELLLREEFDERCRLVLESLALGVRSGLLIEDANSIEQAVNITLNDDSVVYAYVYGLDGQLLFHHRRQVDATGQVLKVGGVGPEVGDAHDRGDVRRLTKVVLDAEGQLLGNVSVGVSLEDLHALERRTLLQLAMFMAAFLTLGGLLAYRFAHSISRPIEQMTATIGEISVSRDLSKRVQADADIAELRVLGHSFNQLIAEIEASQGQLRENERLNKELEIAASIQSALLPRADAVRSPHYDVFAVMKPAEEVGGDYYDIIEGVDGRLWLGIGDVSGHGLTSGLYMMMVQSAAASFLRARPEAGPRELVANVNATLYQNMRHRFDSDDFFTACALALEPNGRVLHSGKHLPVIVYRHAAGRCELFETQGVWVGILPDIAPMLSEESFQLAAGDMVILYTDGLIEARDIAHQQFDLPALVQSIERHGRSPGPLAELAAGILADVAHFVGDRPADDDLSLLIVRKA